MGYAKESNKLYFGIPSGSLHDQALGLLEESGRPVETGRLYELRTPFDSEVVFRVLGRKEMPEEVAKGIVDCGPGGGAALRRTSD